MTLMIHRLKKTMYHHRKKTVSNVILKFLHSGIERNLGAIL